MVIAMKGSQIEEGIERSHVTIAVAIWLWIVVALVFAMIVVGGATRLTDSGLSITQWQPLLGAIPPMSASDWQSAFEQYKRIPQYTIVNNGMTLEAFKQIYWWEWSHRLLGRLIGAAFAIPFLIFWWNGKIRRGSALKFVGVLALGGLQGLVGWYMVKSGLSDRVLVSPYWLAFHLAMAFSIMGLLVWLALEEGGPLPQVGTSTKASIVRLAFGLVALIGLQVVLGAFVAGLKAGLIYNSWPLMDEQIFPSDYWLEGEGWRSIFESHAAAQFNHRTVAYLVGMLALIQGVQVARSASADKVRTSAYLLVAVVFTQIVLGIFTLLYHVPLALGLLHQGGAALVFILGIIHLHAVRRSGSGLRV